MLQRHPRPKPFIVQEPPEDDVFARAHTVISNQEMAVYQRLYAAGFTFPQPYGTLATPLYSRRSPKHSACIEVGVPTHPEYTFLVRTREDVLTVVEKAERIFQAIQEGRQKQDPRMCCAFAEQKGCVCTLSYTCWLHGQQCIGTHD